VEQDGKNPQQSVIAIIPARYASTRLKGKLLRLVGDKPLIIHTLEQTKKARNISRVIVATDDERILRVIVESGHEAVMTSPNHQSGSDRIAEVAANLPPNSIIVNVQGDEPLIPPGTIEKAVEALLNEKKVVMSTTCERIESYQDVISPDVVKVVTDVNGFALYFSRSPIPFPRDAVKKHGTLESALQNEPDLITSFRKHTGLYVYRREFLLRFTKLQQSNLEKTEMLEQLRSLENGAKIKVVEVEESSIGVDTIEDLERVKKIIELPKIIFREAAIEDIPRIAKVHLESWQKSFAGIAPPEFLDQMSVETRIVKFEQAFKQTGLYKIFVAESPETGIVGFADFGESPGKDRFEADLYAIYFLPEFQRRGIGAKLFRMCQNEMVGYGFNTMSLETLALSPYRKFYEKMGGQIIGEGTHSLGGVEFKTVFYAWEGLSKR
jgi:3-deoxy-manno-octulosonate cytidylyltransferase (CMP-KDO synthetase)